MMQSICSSLMPKSKFEIVIGRRINSMSVADPWETASTSDSLGKNSDALARLRERLFILWGDLEERKTRSTATAPRAVSPNTKKSKTDDDQAVMKNQHPSGKVFECCLKEYGVRVRRSHRPVGASAGHDGQSIWERRYQMFGTTIM